MTTQVQYLSLFGVVTMYNHTDRWLRVSLVVEDCDNVAWITCGSVLNDLELGPGRGFTTGVFRLDIHKPYSFKHRVSWYDASEPGNWRSQYSNLSTDRLVRKEIDAVAEEMRSRTPAAQSASAPRATPGPAVAATPAPGAQRPVPAQPPLPAAAPAANGQADCGTKGQIQWINATTDIPRQCYMGRERNWVVGFAGSTAELVCSTATRPSSEGGKPIPDSQVKKLSSCFCGRNMQWQGSPEPFLCFTFYDREYP
ncbi:MAG: hypothetical protein V4731_15515 [Pseudomonadota bacterium]